MLMLDKISVNVFHFWKCQECVCIDVVQHSAVVRCLNIMYPLLWCVPIYSCSRFVVFTTPFTLLLVYKYKHEKLEYLVAYSLCWLTCNTTGFIENRLVYPMHNEFQVHGQKSLWWVAIRRITALLVFDILHSRIVDILHTALPYCWYITHYCITILLVWSGFDDLLSS